MATQGDLQRLPGIQLGPEPGCLLDRPFVRVPGTARLLRTTGTAAVVVASGSRRTYVSVSCQATYSRRRSEATAGDDRAELLLSHCALPSTIADKAAAIWASRPAAACW